MTRISRDASMRDESAANLAERGQLLTRMAGASAMTRASTSKDGQDLTFFTLGRSGLLAVDADGTRAATAQAVAEAMSLVGRMPVPADRSALAAMTRVAEQGGKEYADTARAIGVLRRMPVTTRMFTLTDALDRKYWSTPGMDRGSLGAWAKVLGYGGAVTGMPVIGVLRSLAARCLDTSGNQARQRGIIAVVQKSEDTLAAKAGRPGAMAAAGLFRIAGTLDEAWGAYQRTDSLLYRTYLARGEVVAVSNPRWELGQMVGDLSTPCKLKPREILGFTVPGGGVEHGQDFTLRLNALGFDGGLVGVFSTGGSQARARSRDGQRARANIGWLVETGQTFYITSNPYLGAAGGGAVSPRWFTNGAMEPAKGPALPVDIAIAGGPVE